MTKIKKLMLFSLLILLPILFTTKTFAWYMPIGSVNILFQDENGNSIEVYDSETDTYISSIFKYGKLETEYSIEIPDKENYTKDTDLIEGIYSGNVTYIVTYYKNECLLTIYYLSDDEIINEKEEINFFRGDSYHIDSKEFEGYTPTDTYFEGIINGDTEITFNYILNQYDLIIHYYDMDNNQLSNDDNYTLNYNDCYSFNAKAIYGYIPTISNIEGNIKEDIEYTFYYEKCDYLLTINYIENDEIIKTEYYDYKYLDEYNLDLSLEGFNLDVDHIEGVITDNKTINIEVSKLKFELIIHYVDQCGNKLYDDYSSTLNYNDEYYIESPFIEGYELPNDVFGTITSDTEITVIYNVKMCTLIIHYVNIEGCKIYPDSIYELEAYRLYSIKLPTNKCITIAITEDTEIYVVCYYVCYLTFKY